VYITGFAILDTRLNGTVSSAAGPGHTMRNFLAHETGHVVGLGHVADPSQLLYPTITSEAPDGYADGDRAGLASLGISGGCLFRRT
jgi:predicted Zn-dependent protease